MFVLNGRYICDATTRASRRNIPATARRANHLADLSVELEIEDETIHSARSDSCAIGDHEEPGSRVEFDGERNQMS